MTGSYSITEITYYSSTYLIVVISCRSIVEEKKIGISQEGTISRIASNRVVRIVASTLRALLLSSLCFHRCQVRHRGVSGWKLLVSSPMAHECGVPIRLVDAPPWGRLRGHRRVHQRSLAKWMICTDKTDRSVIPANKRGRQLRRTLSSRRVCGSSTVWTRHLMHGTPAGAWSRMRRDLVALRYYFCLSRRKAARWWGGPRAQIDQVEVRHRDLNEWIRLTDR